jgi:PAS domain S-box-containing protein
MSLRSPTERELSQDLCSPLINQAIPDALFVHDGEGYFVEVNDRACESLGYSKDELLAMNVADVGQGFDLASAKAAWRHLGPHAPMVLSGHQRRKDGTVFPVQVHFGLFEADGQRLYVGIARDISELERSSASLRQSELRFLTVFERAPIGIAVADRDGNLEDCNPAFRQMLGYGEAELRTAALGSLIHPDDRDANLLGLRGVRAGELPAFDIETRYLRKDGSDTWVREHVCALPDGQGRPAQLLVMVGEMTHRRQAEQHLAESRAKLEAALAGMSDAAFLSDARGGIVEFNDAFARFHRFTDKEDVRRNLARFSEIIEVLAPCGGGMPPDQWPASRALRGEFGVGVEYALRRKDTGEQWRGRFNFAPIRDTDDRIIGAVTTGRDSTERRDLRNATLALSAQIEERARFHAVRQTVDAMAHCLNPP